MSEVSLNLANSQIAKGPKTFETAGSIASNTLFTPVQTVETAGSIASNDSSNGGSFNATA